MTKARRLRPSFRAATAETVIGLLAVTGLRAGELVRLNRDDVDFTAGALAVSATKSGKSRMLALHDTTVAALRAYAIVRDQRWPGTCSPAFFMSIRGQPAQPERAQCHLHCSGPSRRAGASAHLEGPPANPALPSP
jgi:integrase